VPRLEVISDDVRGRLAAADRAVETAVLGDFARQVQSWPAGARGGQLATRVRRLLKLGSGGYAPPVYQVNVGQPALEVSSRTRLQSAVVHVVRVQRVRGKQVPTRGRILRRDIGEQRRVVDDKSGNPFSTSNFWVNGRC